MVYKQTEEYTCGPSAYMEAFCWIKTKSKELKFHELGRIKPSRMFLGVSFLELDPSLYLYIQNKTITKGLVMISFNPKISNFVKEITKTNSHLMWKHVARIKIKKNLNTYIRILNQTSSKKKALLLTYSSWLGDGTLHWIVVKGKNKERKYICSDPYLGKNLLFSEDEIREQLMLVESKKVPLQLVTNFEINVSIP